MTTQEYRVLSYIIQNGYRNQREMASSLGLSLGKINKAIQVAKNEGYIDENNMATAEARKLWNKTAPQNAIILAAGFGLRMLPIGKEKPKGLLQVYGEVLIERMILQLHEAGITDISIVVGHLKENYEYLVDKYGVEIIINPKYATTNNMYSLYLARHKVKNTFIIPCDVWCRYNPFLSRELYSWYMVSDKDSIDSWYRITRKEELVRVGEEDDGNAMIGIAYLLEEDGNKLVERMVHILTQSKRCNMFWEEALWEKNKADIFGKLVSANNVYEINTYEELKQIDGESDSLQSEALQVISDVFGVPINEIRDVELTKKGMTNRSFLFTCKEKRYIMRIPGEGSSELVNRDREYDVYQQLEGKNVCEDILYINPKNGYKISRFIENSRVCDPYNYQDVKKCMTALRKFHDFKIRDLKYQFDFFDEIESYDSKRNMESCFRDYEETKRKVFSLKDWIDKQPRELALSHIDAVPDNYLITDEKVYIIDWEYASIQDPLMDLASFISYQPYSRGQVEDLIDAYFPEGCTKEIRKRIYAYISVYCLYGCSWAQYKRACGVDFGGYLIQVYQKSKMYYKKFKEYE